MAYYKVWVAIEIVTDELDAYDHLSPFSICIGHFDSLEEADKKVIELSGESTLASIPEKI